MSGRGIGPVGVEEGSIITIVMFRCLLGWKLLLTPRGIPGSRGRVASISQADRRRAQEEGERPRMQGVFCKLQHRRRRRLSVKNCRIESMMRDRG